MSIITSVENWFAKFRPYLFAYKKGFFELQYLANSPEAMIGAFKKIPFVKFDDKKQSIAANSLFLNVLFYYREIEEEFFILCSETTFKANVSFRHYYDPTIPADYFCLSLRLDHQDKLLNSVINNAGIPDDSWLLLKPGAKVVHHHFKGTSGRYISVYFTHRWLENYLEHINPEARKVWESFLKAESDHLICPRLSGAVLFDLQTLYNLLFSPDDYKSETYTKTLRKETLNYITVFSSKMRSENINERHFLVNNQERIHVLLVERLLQDYLLDKFPGIEELARKAGVSPTKLKTDFKLIHNQSLFQYYRSHQMLQAAQMLSEKTSTVKEVAHLLGYENASKFASAFKDQFGVLPSVYIKE
jgi:AraC-like DNA-binding protein